MEMAQLRAVLKSDYFALFGLKPNFDIDLSQLKHTYRQLQKKFHPDNFVNRVKEEQVLALSVSAHINNAYSTLASPLERALLMLKMHGLDLDLAQNTHLPEAFLYEQMEVHEEIEMAKQSQDISRLEQIEADLMKKEAQLIQHLEQEFKQNQLTQLIELIKQLAFYNRILNSLTNTINQSYA